MADFTYSEPSAGAGFTRGLATVTNWAGALISIGLLVGVGVWGTKVILRDVSGVPVVLAAEGPMRVAPENPGGESADHQGLSVNDVAGQGIAADPADRLTLAPRPLALSDEDMALGLAGPETAPPSAPTRSATQLGALGEAEPDGAGPGEGSPDQAQVAMTAEDEADEAARLEEGTDMALEDDGAENADADAINSAIAAALSEAISSDIAGVARSARPRLRPGSLERTASLAPLVPVAEETREIAPESLPAGTRLVQLGAFDSAETARSEWVRLDARFGEYLEGKDRVIERATSGGRVFYRLRAHGFDALSDARRFCSALVAENADCIPVVSR